MTQLKTTPGLYTISADINFTAALALGILKEHGSDPHILTRIRILLPTKRACRTLRDAFLRIGEGQPMLLPQMQTFGDIDEEELTISISALNRLDSTIYTPPPMPPLKRQILLTRLIMRIPEYKERPDQALRLAIYLGHFMDQIYTEGLNMDSLADLVPEEFAAHWQITLEFLKIITNSWPDILEENGNIDAADHRIRLIDLLSKHWENNPPKHPVIAAGSTGSIPSTANLLKVITTLPQGYVILPNLDLNMDQKSWDSQDESHPQARLKQLLERMSLSRQDVKIWPQYLNTSIKQSEQHKQKIKIRHLLATELMRPAKTAGEWALLSQNLTSDNKIALTETLKDIQKIECDTPREEANLIALLMRETLEKPDQTAVLITPDRNLARRVVMACRRWGIEIDDSAGQKLSDTPAGSFFRLCINACISDLSPSVLMSLLKHKLCQAGYNLTEYNDTIQLLEKICLRGPAPPPGADGLINKIKDTQNSLNIDLKSVTELVSHITDILTPLLTLCSDGYHPFQTFLDAQIDVAEKLSSNDRLAPYTDLWADEDGESASIFLSELTDQSSRLPKVTCRQYEAILLQLMENVSVRPSYGAHPRLAILGQLEARLMQADLVIMGGLNEGTWPPDPGYDPWLSRHMRHKLTLPSSENSIGLAAHDFIQGFNAKRLVLSRSRRVNSTPTVPSRWLQRLDTVLKALNLDPRSLELGPYKDLANRLDTPINEPTPCKRASFSPPKDKRPNKLSVTQIETLMQDPYSIYAYKILSLKKLKPLAEKADAAIRGTIVHDVLENFISEHKNNIPDNALDVLYLSGRNTLDEEYAGTHSIEFWWPRFKRLGQWFVLHEHKWRNNARPFLLEARGEKTIKTKGGQFTITAKADRIDILSDGGLAIIDYKTGTSPSGSDVLNGYKPQLPLEGVIAADGGFGNESYKNISYLGYWQLSGGVEPGKEKAVNIRNVSTEELINCAEAGLRNLIEAFENDTQEYISLPRIEKAAPKEWRDYDHLARVSEWADLEEADEAS